MSEDERLDILDDEFFDIEISDAEDDPKALDELSKELKDRCDLARIPLKEKTDHPFFEKCLVLELPAGREKRAFVLTDIEDFTKFLSVPFEKYTLLGNYRAICSYQDGVIEASVVHVSRTLPVGLLMRRLARTSMRSEVSDEDVANFHIEIDSDDGSGLKIELTKPSQELNVLTEPVFSTGLSVVISGLDVSQHSQAVGLLERLTDSLFFQMDLVRGVPLTLSKLPRRPGRPIRRGRKELVDLRFPSYEYARAPMSLYRYGKSAVGMPLLRFLAYYQAIEFYFPTYSRVDARRKIQNVLKDPSFRADREEDVSRILSAIPAQGGGGLGDEKTQLRATLRECVEPEELRTFLTESEEREKTLSSRIKGLTDCKIPIANVSADLRNEVADRIYDIRCRIVHTKGANRDGEAELLLPFSAQAEQLQDDIDLIEYLAQRTLVASSSPLKL